MESLGQCNDVMNKIASDQPKTDTHKLSNILHAVSYLTYTLLFLALQFFTYIQSQMTHDANTFPTLTLCPHSS